jgi:hypothetical protein
MLRTRGVHRAEPVSHRLTFSEQVDGSDNPRNRPQLWFCQLIVDYLRWHKPARHVTAARVHFSRSVGAESGWVGGGGAMLISTRREWLGGGAVAVVSVADMPYNDKDQDLSRLASKQSETLTLKYDESMLADEGTNRLGKRGLPSLQWLSACGLVIVDPWLRTLRPERLSWQTPFKLSLFDGDNLRTL